MDNSIIQTKSISIFPERIGYFKKEWLKIYNPIVQLFKLQIRMNLLTKHIDLRTTPLCPDPAMIDKAGLFIQSINKGFSVEDSIIALDQDTFLNTFDILEVKNLKDNHLIRAVGRIIGRNGSTKKVIENVSKTKICVQDTKVNVLGGRENFLVAKDAICRLIMGSEPSKVQSKLKALSSKLKEKFGSIETVYREY